MMHGAPSVGYLSQMWGSQDAAQLLTSHEGCDPSLCLCDLSLCMLKTLGV
jgi:hypothetical protein